MDLQVEKLLDRIGLKILAALQENARTPLARIGEKAGLSAPAVAERVKKLEEAGIIKGYHARIDPAALGRTVSAFIHLTTHARHYPAVTSTGRRHAPDQRLPSHQWRCLVYPASVVGRLSRPDNRCCLTKPLRCHWIDIGHFILESYKTVVGRSFESPNNCMDYQTTKPRNRSHPRSERDTIHKWIDEKGIPTHITGWFC
jgi:hypothetical protein